MRHHIECWIENGLRKPGRPASPAIARRKARWPRDSRLLTLALACCAGSASGRALAQQVPALNVAVMHSYTRHEVTSGEGMLSFDTNGPFPVSGQSSIEVDGFDCWSKEWCYTNCAASADGAVEFSIGPQSILVTCSPSLPSLPTGTVRFTARLSGPTAISWQGGSLALDSASEDCGASDPNQVGDYPVDCDFEISPVTASVAGFPIIASAPFEVVAVDVWMRAFTPGGTWSEWATAGFLCEPYYNSSYHGKCTEPMTSGSWALRGGVDYNDGFLCVCGGYANTSSRFVSDANFSVVGTRIDAQLDVEWGCPEQFTYLGAYLLCRIGFDRPIRVLWDDACGSSFGGLISSTCGPGSVEIWPTYLDPYSGQFQYDQSILFQVWLGASADLPEQGSQTVFRASNIRFERLYPADVAADGIVNGVDIAAVLSNWGGPCIPHWTAADVNLDGQVGAEDLAAVLFAWGTPG